jgi:hypothetical protein
MAGNVITRTDFKDIGHVRRGKVRMSMIWGINFLS